MTGPRIEDRAFDELTGRQLHDVLRLRIDVFVVEQQCPYRELDGRDTESATRHVWIADADEQPLAYLRLLDDGADQRIGRVVVRTDVRAQGLARELVQHAVRTHPGPWVVDAQAYLREWYERLGFEVSGPEFVEDGIPHVPMRCEGST